VMGLASFANGATATATGAGSTANGVSAVSMNYVASIFSLTCDAVHLGLDRILHLHSES